MDDLAQAVEGVYETLDGSGHVVEYAERHAIQSAQILTINDRQAAENECALLLPWIANTHVVEIGAGVGLLAVEMARVARSVIAFECDPAWSWVFTRFLYLKKPPNLTWVFGDAKRFVGSIHADVAVIYTCSDIEGMRTLGSQLADSVVMAQQVHDTEVAQDFPT